MAGFSGGLVMGLVTGAAGLVLLAALTDAPPAGVGVVPTVEVAPGAAVTAPPAAADIGAAAPVSSQDSQAPVSLAESVPAPSGPPALPQAEADPGDAVSPPLPPALAMAPAPGAVAPRHDVVSMPEPSAFDVAAASDADREAQGEGVTSGIAPLAATDDDQLIGMMADPASEAVESIANELAQSVGTGDGAAVAPAVPLVGASEEGVSEKPASASSDHHPVDAILATGRDMAAPPPEQVEPTASETASGPASGAVLPGEQSTVTEDNAAPALTTAPATNGGSGGAEPEAPVARMDASPEPRDTLDALDNPASSDETAPPATPTAEVANDADAPAASAVADSVTGVSQNSVADDDEAQPAAAMDHVATALPAAGEALPAQIATASSVPVAAASPSTASVLPEARARWHYPAPDLTIPPDLGALVVHPSRTEGQN